MPLIADGSGGCFVVWGSGSTPVESQTYCQRLDADGNRLWDPAGVLVSSAPLFQTYFLEHCLMADGSGGMFICWQEMHSSTDYDIFCQRVNADSSMNWADKAVICDAVDNQLHPVMVSDCAGGAIVVWQDYRKGTAANIFTQHVDTVAAIPSGLKTAFPSATATIPRSIRTQPATTAAAPISFGRIYAAS
jgi:hypothetical protein